MNRKNAIILWLVLAVIILWVTSILASCSLLENTSKSKRQTQKDTVYVSKIDTGYLNRIKSENETNWEWFKTTYKFNDANDGDTTINNYYSPQPKVIVVEGGKGKSNTIIQQVDSGYRNKYDSLSASIKETEKTKESKPPFMLILFVGIGFLVIVAAAVIIMLYKLNVNIKKVIK